MTNYSRRDFIKIITNSLLSASGLLGLGGLLRYLNFSTETPVKTEFDLGLASDYPLGSRTLFPDIPAVLIHDDKGFSALSLVCSHLGCIVQDNNNGFICPCHGSYFDINGDVQRGPARHDLRLLRVDNIEDNRLILFIT